MNSTPLPYQLEDVIRIENEMNGKALVSWSMSLGKTFLSLFYMQRHPEIRPAVCICPATLKWNWELEAKKHFGIRAEVLETTNPKKRGSRNPAPLTIINYDILAGNRRTGLYPWMDFLKGLEAKLIIVDECQALLDHTSLRSKAVRMICEDVPHLLFLSGTPLVNRPKELFCTLNILQPERFRGFWSFSGRYCNRKRNVFGGWDVNGASNLDELHRILVGDGNGNKGIMIRRLKQDVLKDLPPKIRTILPLEISNRKEYNLALKDFLGWVKQRHPTRLDGAERAERLVQLCYLKRLAGTLKLPAVNNWIDDFLASSDADKMIVFAVHKAVIAELSDRYKDQCVVVDGSVVGKQRQLAIDKFLHGKRTRLLFGNIKAAGTGWNAKGVSTVAFIELPWNPGSVVQCEDRAHGLGRGVEKEPTNVYYLVAKDTIEHKLVEIIQKKMKILDSVLDGGESPDNLDLFDELCRLLREDHEN